MEPAEKSQSTHRGSNGQAPGISFSYCVVEGQTKDGPENAEAAYKQLDRYFKGQEQGTVSIERKAINFDATDHFTLRKAKVTKYESIIYVTWEGWVGRTFRFISRSSLFGTSYSAEEKKGSVKKGELTLTKWAELDIQKRMSDWRRPGMGHMWHSIISYASLFGLRIYWGDRSCYTAISSVAPITQEHSVAPITQEQSVAPTESSSNSQ